MLPFVLFVTFVSFVFEQGELIERTLAIVSGQVITLSEVRTATALGLIDGPTSVEQMPAATTKLIERTLVLREVQRYLPREPAVTAIDDRVQAIRARLGEDHVAKTLAAGGFSDNWLRAWVRDDLRIAGYLEQRFAAAGERRADMINDWIADLRRRTPVVELYKKP